jgi:Protein of unknown function (DUF4231)
MSYSKITASEQKKTMEMNEIWEESSSYSQKNLLPLKVTEYLLLTIFITLSIMAFVLQDNQRLVIGGAISLALLIFLFLFNTQLSRVSRETAYQAELKKKAELYLMNSSDRSTKNPITPAREKALQYSQELIDDYKKTRNLSRNLYYGLQMATIVFSGVTPILVLVDKLEAGLPWLKWLPVICPAIASIVASVVTSFPFQENWISANTTVELLEAEQEKFILGITPAYRCYDSSDEIDRDNRAKQAIENYIIHVNNIHLKQVQETSEPKQKEQQQEEKTQPEQLSKSAA